MKNGRYFLYSTFSLLFASTFFQTCNSTKASQATIAGTYRAAFYNVENLFDTLNLESKADDEYTPDGKKHHNTENYFDKINQLSKVVEAMEYPGLLGMCEVENEAVLKDFINETSLKSHKYEIVHFESPDERGIDNAFIYKSDQFKVLSSNYIRINFPKELDENDHTRDIVYINGKLAGNVELHIFVNHWPSRRGGIEKSEPKRMFVAAQLRKVVDSIFVTNANANILIMGDLNDEPDRKSVVEVLGAKTSVDVIEEKSLYNLMAEFHRQGKGSYTFQGNWNMIDNIIVSTSMAKPNSKVLATNPTVFQKDWMMYTDKKNNTMPSKSYGRSDYYGGYSDHLPIFIDIIIK